VTGPIYGVNVDGLNVLNGKRLDLLKTILPSMVRVAYVESQAIPSTFPSVQSAAAALGIKAVNIDVSSPADIAPAFETASAMSADAVLLSASNNTFNIPQHFTELATRNHLPAMYSDRVFTDAGGMMSYGASIAATNRRAAVYVDRILKGANPADLPVEQPTTFELVVSRKGLADLGLSLPPDVASQVTEWVP
jgi:putative ABC transport system substrate-binding protein